MSCDSHTECIRVLVTGFGPFPRSDGTTYIKNSSHEITKLLPDTLSPSSPFNPTSTEISILNPTATEGSAVKVEYAHIRNYTSALHSTHGNDVDLILHIGMADGWDFISCERRAYKQTFTSSWGSRVLGLLGRYYMIKDFAGKTVKDAGPCPWDDDVVPMGLCTGLDVDKVVEGAGKTLKGMFGRDVRGHEDGGTYCCGFIYYESLANKFTKGSTAEVLFCHVPGDLDQFSLKAGANSICAIVGAAASQILEERKHRAPLGPVATKSQEESVVAETGTSTVSAQQRQRAMEMMASGYGGEQALQATKFNA
ncbi:peptidase C15, pyroglutamyl peptidase I-like protein [Aureobasidium subglaciale]|nr:peptidase C15, pyroglutamyl peptidase I-like protein [Aureobasidium subglaciale]